MANPGHYSGGGAEQDHKGLELTLANLTSELEEVTDSHWLGVVLDVPDHVLHEFEVNYSKDTHRCKSEAIAYWKKNESNPSWHKIVAALEKMRRYKKLMQTICKKTGLIPRFIVQPKDLNANFGETVPFECEARVHGGKITYLWKHDSQVMKKPSSPTLKIDDVTLGDRGNYKCVAKNDFGHEKESEVAELIIGKTFTKDTLKMLLKEKEKEVGIDATDWPEIGRALDLQESLVKAFFRGTQKCPKEYKLSWPKIAQALERMEGCQSAAQKAMKNAGKKLNKETVAEMFRDAEIELGPDWRRIGEKLLGHSFKPSESGEYTGPEPDVLLKNVSWEELAKALDEINFSGYRSVAEEARGFEVNEQSLCDVFREANQVDWHQIVKKLELTKFGYHFLIEVLLIWRNQQSSKDPWMIWRKLAALIEGMKDDDSEKVKAQLGIGYKLRLLSGVGLKLNKENMCKVVKGSGAEVGDLNDIVSKLIPTTIATWFKGRLQSIKQWIQGSSSTEYELFEEMLKKWPKPHSWEELARVAEETKYGLKVAQKIRELSGSGGYPKITSFCAPELSSYARVKSNMTVTFTCEARGAAPLRYVWIHDDRVIPQEGSSTLKVEKVQQGGVYSCRVENEFGSETSELITLVVGDPPHDCMIVTDGHGENIPVGKDLKLHCKAKGTDPLTYTWVRNGRELSAHQGPVLMIKEVSEEDDQGEYKCTVVNKFGTRSSTIRIKVGEPPVITSTDIEGIYRNNYVRGVTVNLYCDATGKLPLEYSWLHNGFPHATEDKYSGRLKITTGEDTEGVYKCLVKNDFGKMTSKEIKLKVGDKPQIKAAPKILGKPVPGGQVHLTCVGVGGPFDYVWMHNNQTLVKETRSRLTIEHITEADQGDYRCRLTNAFGYAVSDPANLRLEITREQLMEFFYNTAVADRWHMFGILLEVAKPILDRIARGFAANGNANYSLQEVIGSWLEETNNPTKPHNWRTVRDVVRRMGHEKLAQDLGAKPEVETPLKVQGTGEKITLTCKATGKPPLSYTWLCDDVEIDGANQSKFTILFNTEPHEGRENEGRENEGQENEGRVYMCRVSNKSGSAQSETVTLYPGVQPEPKGMTNPDETKEHDNYGAKDVKREFDKLALRMKQLLASPDPSDTERNTTADETVSEIQAYLHLLKPKECDEDNEQTKDLSSALEFLSQYWDYQRYHLLTMAVNRFYSEEVEMFLNQFHMFQAATTLGNLPPVTQMEGSPECTIPTHVTVVGEPPVQYPPFMRTFRINLESTWATCTLRDAENLLVNLLPDTVSREFVWSSRTYRAEGNSWCLEYVVSPLVAEAINSELEMKSENMSSIGILGVKVDGFDVVEPKPIKTRPHFHDSEPVAQPLVLKDQTEQLKEMEELKVEIKVEQRTQASEIEALKKQLTETKDKLEKSLHKVARHTGELEKLRTDKDMLETKVTKHAQTVKKEVIDAVTTEHIDRLEDSLKKQEDKVTKIPTQMKEARRKDISKVEVQVLELKEQMKKSSQSTEETEKKLNEMLKDQKHLEEKRWTIKEAAEKQMEKELQECKDNIQKLQMQVSRIDGLLRFESRIREESEARAKEIGELRREIEKLKPKET